MMSVRQQIRTLLIASVMLLATGCAFNVSKYSPDEISRLVEMEGVKFDKTIRYTGLTIESKGERSSVEDIHLTRLYAERSKTTGKVNFYVQADVLNPSGMRYYRQARFNDSSSVRVKTLWFAQNPCTGRNCYKRYFMRFPVDLTRLLKKPKLEFRLESLTGKTNVFTIPRNHIEGFVIAIKQHQKFRDTPVAKPKPSLFSPLVLGQN